MGERVLQREHAVPRPAEQEEVLRPEFQRPAHLVDLVDEALDRPEIRIAGLVAVVGVELVVVDVLDALGRQVAVETFIKLMGGARPAVQQQHANARVVAEALDPDRELTFWRFDRDAADAAGPLIGCFRIVQVGFEVADG